MKVPLWLMAGVVAVAATSFTQALGSAVLDDPTLISRGENIYDRCRACHALHRNRTGPRHCGLLGRKAGSLPAFRYSKAMRKAELIWTRDNLDRFLANPRMVVPGNRMGYAGIRADDERRALIAYLTWIDTPEGPCRLKN